MNINTKVFLAIGFLLFLVGISIKVIRENNNSLKHKLPESLSKKLSVKNQNLTIVLAVISIIIGVISLVKDNSNDGSDQSMTIGDSLTYPTIQVINFSDPETDSETDSEVFYNYSEVTQATTSYDLFQKETDNYYSDNIITNDCVLEDTFSEFSNKKKYELKSSYNSEYGFDFSIDNIDLRYTALIMDEKGSIVKEFDIPSNKNAYAVKLNKNCTYTIMVEAEKGYPKFSINISYPENDDF